MLPVVGAVVLERALAARAGVVTPRSRVVKANRQHSSWYDRKEKEMSTFALTNNNEKEDIMQEKEYDQKMVASTDTVVDKSKLTNPWARKNSEKEDIVNDKKYDQKLVPGTFGGGVQSQRLTPGTFRGGVQSQRLTPGTFRGGIQSQRLTPGTFRGGVQSQRLTPGTFRGGVQSQRLTPGTFRTITLTAGQLLKRY